MATSTLLHHSTAHDLALLERFVNDGVQHLPSLTSSRSRQLPSRGAAYHTNCAAMLREILQVLMPLSPRLGQLIAQVWDLTSLNVFVLLQLAQTALDDEDRAIAKWRTLQRFCDETTSQHAQRVTKYEADLDRVRRESRELRAELQKTRQRANRLGVENAQLRKAVHGLLEMNDALHSRVESAVEKLDDTPLGETAIGDAEEWDLYGVSADQLDKLDVVHPIESFAQDFDQLFEGLVDRAREQLGLVNEMDRFMNSSVVSLLWRHGPDDDHHTKFLQQMMSKRTAGTQTDDVELGGLLNEDDDDEDEEEEEDDNQSNVSGATGTATVVTKRQLLPAPLRAQLTTRPKIQRVLEKEPLSRVLLLVLLDKMEIDGMALRAVPLAQPRVPLHRVMKEFFVRRYGLVSLAEYRMMEAVKSVLYCHEKHEAEARRRRLMPSPLTEETAEEEDDANAFSLLPGLDPQQFSPADLRIALFACLSELVPLQWPPTLVRPAGGNLLACATNAVVDFVGDIIELDVTSASVKDVVERREWTLPRDVAHVLITHHFSHCAYGQRQRILRRLERLTTAEDAVVVDALLLFFATQWYANDQHLTASLHDAFHREATSTEVSSPIETLKRVWRTLPAEHVSLAELDELEHAFTMILELRQVPSRRMSKRPSVAVASVGLSVGGVTENEFVFQSQQILRARRVCRGLRTNGRGVSVIVEASGGPTTSHVLGPRGRSLPSETITVVFDDLKPTA